MSDNHDEYNELSSFSRHDEITGIFDGRYQAAIQSLDDNVTIAGKLPAELLLAVKKVIKDKLTERSNVDNISLIDGLMDVCYDEVDDEDLPTEAYLFSLIDEIRLEMFVK